MSRRRAVETRPAGRPTARAILGVTLAFGLAALAAWGLEVWQERRAHEALGPGRVVVEPHRR
jgi:hypothetical protein